MKKYIILVVLLAFTATATYAQDYSNNNNNNNGYYDNGYKPNDQYTANYYLPVMWGMNGFRSVEEENRLMNEALAARKKQREREELSPAELAIARKRHDEELAAKKKEYDAKNKSTTASSKAVKK